MKKADCDDNVNFTVIVVGVMTTMAIVMKFRVYNVDSTSNHDGDCDNNDDNDKEEKDAAAANDNDYIDDDSGQ